jgi:hypothetical protein
MMHQSLFRDPFKGQRRGINLLLTLTLMFTLFLTAFTVVNVNAASSLTLGSSTIRYGQRVSLSGSGFNAGEKIAIWASGPNGAAVDMGYVNAGNDGSFNAFSPVTTISNGTPGAWAVAVQGLTSGNQSSVPFTLLSPTLSIVTSLNIADTVVLASFAGSNWYPGEQISAWITDGIGTVLSVGYFYANADGTLPASPWIGFAFLGSSGSYKLTTYGNTSGQTSIVSFNADKI